MHDELGAMSCLFSLTWFHIGIVCAEALKLTDESVPDVLSNLMSYCEIM